MQRPQSPDMPAYRGSLRPCLAPPIAPRRRRAIMKQVLNASDVVVLGAPDAPHRERAQPEDDEERDRVQAARASPEVDAERRDTEDRRAVERDIGATGPQRDRAPLLAPHEIDEERNREEERDARKQEESRDRRLQRQRDDDRRDCSED